MIWIIFSRVVAVQYYTYICNCQAPVQVSKFTIYFLISRLHRQKIWQKAVKYSNWLSSKINITLHTFLTSNQTKKELDIEAGWSWHEDLVNICSHHQQLHWRKSRPKCLLLFNKLFNTNNSLSNVISQTVWIFLSLFVVTN